MGLPYGSNNQSGGVTWLPNAGDQIIVMFLDGEPEKPVWSWGPRTITAAKNCTYIDENSKTEPLVAYNDKGVLQQKKILSAYNQSIILSPNALHIRNATGDFLELSSKDDYALLSTSTGYSVSCANSSTALNGSVTLRTPLGSYFSLDDSVKSAVLNVDTLAMTVTDVVVSAVDVDISASGSVTLVSMESASVTSPSVSIVATTKFDVTSPAISLSGITRLGSSTAFDPVVRKSDLVQIITWLSMHTHGNGNMGSPTASPMQPIITPVCSTMVSAV
jgi:hypothetical protein